MFWAEVCVIAIPGVQFEMLARARPHAQILVKNEPKVNHSGCFLIQLDCRRPTVEKSIIGGILESESKLIVSKAVSKFSSSGTVGNVGVNSFDRSNELSPPLEVGGQTMS